MSSPETIETAETAQTVETAQTIETAASPETPLVTRAFVSLAATSLVFFIAGGIVLPIVSPFATGPLGSDKTLR